MGWPKPHAFKTRKEANVRLQKLNHQAKGVLGELRVEEISEEKLNCYLDQDKTVSR
jgi:hypothetical protein